MSLALPVIVLAVLAWLYISDSVNLAEVIQGIILAVLAWYAAETRKIRRVSQQQLEALHRPCLLLATEARDPDEALLGTDDTVTVLIVSSHNGNTTVENIGNGPAVNIGFEFKAVSNTEGNDSPPRSTGYPPSLAETAPFTVPFPREVLRNQEYEFACSYESLGGAYESRIRMNNLVVTSIQCKCVSQRSLRQIIHDVVEGAKEGAKGKPWVDDALKPWKRKPRG